MRKRTLNFLIDNIFWYILYILPVLSYLLYLLAEPSSSANIVNLADFFDQCGFCFDSSNIIFNTLSSVFGSGGVLPLFSSNTAILILTWFVSVYLAHLLIEFLLFIPKLCEKWLKCFTKGD